MPLLNERHEKFCQEIARDASIEAAMANAGYAQNNAYTNGLKILQRPDVKERVAELCRELGKKGPNTPPRVQAPPTISPGRPRKYIPPDPDDIDLEKITYDWVLREAVTSYLLAKAQRNAALMVKMLDMIGRLSGFDRRIGRPKQHKDPNKGDLSNDKPKPDDPIDFAALVAGYGGDSGGAGDDAAEEDTADPEAEGGTE